MTMEDVQEEIRQMKWDLRILRDQAFRVADNLPPEDRERIADVADRITEATRELIAAVREDEMETEEEAVARLSQGILHVQEQLKHLARELNDVADGLFPH